MEQYNKSGLIYHSLDIKVEFDEKEQKYKKMFVGAPPKYANITMKRHCDESKNSCIVFMGPNYGNIIGFDVDNKDDSVERFRELCETEEIDIDTFTHSTMNGGFHYIYKLSDKQALILEKMDFKSFDSSKEIDSNKIFGMHIDVKYKNQILFGYSNVKYGKKTLKYVIENDSVPVIMPDIMFDEIVKKYKSKDSLKSKPVKETKKIESKNIVIESANNDNDNKLRLYLDCLNASRIDSYDDWIRIGAIIYNEKGSFKLFDEYSKKSEKYDQHSVKKLWLGYKEERKKKATIKCLRKLAIADNINKYKESYEFDEASMYQFLYDHPKDDNTYAALFKYYYGDLFVYDKENNKWYHRNKFGIWDSDNEALYVLDYINLLKIKIASYIDSEYEKDEYEDDDNTDNHKKKRFAINNYLMSTKNKLLIIKDMTSKFQKKGVFTKFDNVNHDIIAFENGVFDLKTKEFRKAKAEEYVLTTTGYEYSKVDKSFINELNKILESIQPNKETLNYLLKTLALSLSGSAKTEHFYMWLGNGSNGKSLLYQIMRNMLGGYFDCMEISYLAKDNYIRAGGADPEMAKKKSSRLVITSEPDDGMALKSSAVKKISGGDELQVRNLYGNSFNFVPRFQLIILSNNAIEIQGSDGGIVRRFRLINFPIKFVKNPTKENERPIDIKLKDKLDNINYKLAMFEILLSYYDLYNKEGLEMPDEIRIPTEEYIGENDPVKEFIENTIEITGNKNDFIKSSELYEMYKDSKLKHMTQQQFSVTLRQKGYQSKKNNYVYWVGMKLKLNNIGD